MGENQRGVANPNWRGGKSITKHGYVLIRVGTGHPLADVRGYAYEHRVVASEKIGRLLRRREQVHHVNGDKQDNRPENLHVMPSLAEHRVAHRKTKKRLRMPDEPNPLVQCACGCGAIFRVFDRDGRPRRFVPGHNRPPRNSLGQFGASP